MRNVFYFTWSTLMLASLACQSQSRVLVFQSDFGLKDAAVATMKGVAVSVSTDLKIYDATHEIEAYNIMEAAYRLKQTASYWPVGTVFVSIVDPGVGSKRKSIVLKTKTGHFFVTPDNGTVTLVAEMMGVAEVREIDEATNRLKNSEQSYTFHGRDVYAYTGARLAAGVITFEQVGGVLKEDIVRLPISKPTIVKNEIVGDIPVLDIQYGNVWTNIDSGTLRKLQAAPGDLLRIQIYYRDELKYESKLPFVTTFAQVDEGRELVYLNSLLNVALAVRQGNFAGKYGIKSGEGWSIKIGRVL